MINIKDYVASLMIGKRYHFKCDCLFPLDFVGVVKGFKIHNNEIIFSVDNNGRMIDIGLNHPKMTIAAID